LGFAKLTTLSLDGAKLYNLTKYYTINYAFCKIIQISDIFAFHFKTLKKYGVFINNLVLQAISERLLVER